MSKPPTDFDGPSDFNGSGSFRTIHGDNVNAECCLFLPKSEIAKIWILIRTNTWTPISMSWKFSCELRAQGKLLKAEEVFHSGWKGWNWGNGEENTLVGEVTKLSIVHGDLQNSAIVSARFFLTPSALLRSADILATNEGRIRVLKQARAGPTCRVSDKVSFQFNSSYYPESSRSTRQSLHCDLVNPKATQELTEISEILDDVLVVAALAEGRSILLTGWEAQHDNGANVKYYRRDFTPKDEEIDIDDTLISLNDIEPFLSTSVPRFLMLSSRNALKQAIRFTISGQEPSLASSFAMLFTALETLLNVFRSEAHLETIVPKKRWRRLRAKVWSVLAEDESVRSLTADRRAALENRVAQLNQISFADAFRGMCSSYKIELGDLWPMVGSNRASLYALRNRIVHGRLFASDREWFRLASAKYHLLWTLQRSILAFVEWPLQCSRASSEFLSQKTLYSSWHDDHEYFLSAKNS